MSTGQRPKLDRLEPFANGRRQRHETGNLQSWMVFDLRVKIMVPTSRTAKAVIVG